MGKAIVFASKGPRYAWRWLVHPYMAAGLVSLLLVLPYSVPFNMPILFPDYTHYATLAQHLAISTGLSLVIFSGVTAGLMFAGKDSDTKRLENIKFMSSRDALLLFGSMLALSWLVMMIITPLALAQIKNGAVAARLTMKSLGGLAFLGRLPGVCLLPLLASMRLQGRPILLVVAVTVFMAMVQSFATFERFQVVQVLVAVILYIALYQPHILKLSTFALVIFLLVGFLGVNLAQRALVPVPLALRTQFQSRLPEIALGTILTYPSDTTNKLYFQMLQSRLDRSVGDGFYFTIPNSFLGRLGVDGLQLGSAGPETPEVRGAYEPGKASALDFDNGRNPMMTNLGGPTEDYVDFGWLMPAVLFLKFFIFARVYVAARRFDPLCMALLPALFAAAIVYTQLNILYQVEGGMPAVAACIIIPVFRYIAARARPFPAAA